MEEREELNKIKGNVHVLHVDDEPLFLDISKHFLEKESQITVENIDSAQSALSLLNDRSFDVILSDYEMAEMNGISFLKELRSRGYEHPFILFTGKGREEVVIEAFNNGATFYLQKGGKPEAQFTELTKKILHAAGQFRNQKKIAHLYRLFKSLRFISETLYSDKEQEIKLDQACRIITSDRGYKDVRIVLFNKTGDIRTIHQSGLDTRMSTLYSYLAAGNRTTCTKKALEMNREIVICEPNQTCNSCPFYHDHLGYYALTIRLEHGGEIYGIISATMESDYANDPDEQSLFQELAREISYALHHYNLEEEQNAMKILLGVNKKLDIINTITRHDIRNDLTIQMHYHNLLKEEIDEKLIPVHRRNMSGYYQFLKEDVDDTLNIQDYVEKIGLTMNNIQEHIMFSEIYQKIGIQKPRWLSVRGIVEGLKHSHQFETLVITHATSTLEVYTDQMFGKILINLIENAIMHGKRVTSININFIEQLQEGVLVIEDDGIGIPNEMKQTIFQKGVGKNTGLGLFYTKEILGITEMVIKETGIFGQGAKFEIYIPKNCYRLNKSEKLINRIQSVAIE